MYLHDPKNLMIIGLVYFLSFERSELEGKYAPIVLGRHSSTSTVSA